MCQFRQRPSAGEFDLIDPSQPPQKRAGTTGTRRAVKALRTSDYANSVIGVRPLVSDLLRLRAVEARGVKLVDFIRAAISEKLNREAV